MNFESQRTFYYNFRVLICDILNKSSIVLYTKVVKYSTQKWDINLKYLNSLSKDSLGNHLLQFLIKENFELMPKHESHDIYHILGQYGTKKEQEIALQFFLFGNGKHSLYLYLSLLIGLILFPEYYLMYKHAYLRGKEAYPFFKINFEKLLHYPIDEIRGVFNINYSNIKFNN